MRDARLLLPVAFLAALVGGLTGALVTLALTDSEEGGTYERGTVVRMGADLPLDGPWCSDYHHFCIPEFADPRDARALYLGDTHDLFREAGCFVEWRPGFDLSSYEIPPGVTDDGAYRGGCSGSTFLSDGTRVFGPSPRNLDEFAISYHEETREFRDGEEYLDRWFEVDTRTLICGDWGRGVDPDDVPDPECELAPPYD